MPATRFPAAAPGNAPAAAPRAPVTGTAVSPPPMGGGGGGAPQAPMTGTAVSPPGGGGNKGYQSSPMQLAAGGPVLNQKRTFVKNIPKTADEFTGGRLPVKQSAAVKQDYGSKGAPSKR